MEKHQPPPPLSPNPPQPMQLLPTLENFFLQALPLLTFQLRSAVTLRAGRCCSKSPGSPPSQFQLKAEIMRSHPPHGSQGTKAIYQPI